MAYYVGVAVTYCWLKKALTLLEYSMEGMLLIKVAMRVFQDFIKVFKCIFETASLK